MNLRPSSSSWAQWLIALALFALAMAASAQSAAPAPSNQVTLSLDQDLITFAKWAVGLLGFLLTVFAIVGTVFFGWDVIKTRNAMMEARDDIAKRLAAIRDDHSALKELKDRLEKLGAQLEEKVVKKPLPAPTDEVQEPTAAPPSSPPPPSVPSLPSQRTRDQEELDALNDEVLGLNNHSKYFERRLNLIRDALASSNFEWTTMGTLQKKTGLTLEDIEHVLLSSDEFEQTIQKGGTRLVKRKAGIDWSRSTEHMSDEFLTQLLMDYNMPKDEINRVLSVRQLARRGKR